MMKKVLFSFALVGLAVASAKSYTVNLYQTAKVGSTELKPGEYRVDVEGDKAVIRNGKFRGETPVKVETGDQKYGTTSVRLTNTGTVQEIRLGGTHTKLVFGDGSSATNN
jgi:hypothetical protein